MSGQWIDRFHERKPPKYITLEMDSSVRHTAHGRAQHGTVISAVCVIIRNLASTNMATSNAALSVAVMSIARMDGKGV